jgi:hypothetical protein
MSNERVSSMTSAPHRNPREHGSRHAERFSRPYAWDELFIGTGERGDGTGPHIPIPGGLMGGGGMTYLPWLSPMNRLSKSMVWRLTLSSSVSEFDIAPHDRSAPYSSASCDRGCPLWLTMAEGFLPLRATVRAIISSQILCCSRPIRLKDDDALVEIFNHSSPDR